MWVLAHVGLREDEDPDMLMNQVLQRETVFKKINKKNAIIWSKTIALF